MELIELKNALYRQKARLLFGKGWLSRLRQGLWNRNIPSGVVKLIYSNEQECFPPDDLSRFEDERMRSRLEAENTRWRKGTDSASVIRGPLLLEPENSLGITRDGLFFEETKCSAHRWMQPSMSTRVQAKWARPTISVDNAVFFDGYASRNLYHFFNDALNDLVMALDLNIVSPSTPIIVSRNVFDTKWFSWVREHTPFSDLKWIVQEPGEWIECGQLTIPSACHNWWKRTRELLSAPHRGKTGGRRIYIDRSIRHARSIEDRDSLFRVLEKHSVSPKLLEEMAFADQIDLFSEAELIVGLHGAGLTHVMWADPTKVAVLELFSSDYIMPHYYWLCRTLGIGAYDNLIGGLFDNRYMFNVDFSKLDERLSIARMN